MPKPRAFISSTYLDLRDVRDTVGNFLESRGFEVQMFERGGVFFDPKLPLDKSCFKEIERSDLFVLLVGGRYGSPASGEKVGREYKSVTRKELETAIGHGIPFLVFVRREVDVELRTFLANPKSMRESLNYASVDNIQVFRLLEQIYQLRKGNPVFAYDTPRDVVEKMDLQLVGYIASALHERKAEAKHRKVRINGFKLFYYRYQDGLSQKQLGERSDLSPRLIQRLEKVPFESKMTLGEHLFQKVDRDALEKLEQALECPGVLVTGQEDDFLSLYLLYYVIYKKRRGKRTVSPLDQLGVFPTRVIVLDFDGTMTLRNRDDLTTWERLWVALGYSVNDCSNLARRYFNGEISHGEWCDLTCDKFIERGFTRKHLQAVAKDIRLFPDVGDVLSDLREQGVSLFIISGSIREIIKTVLGPLYDLFDEVHANDLIFKRNGSLQEIRGTVYDFEGKADFIKSVIARQDVSPLEVLFIGNSLNDVWASNAGARTLCVNPHFTNPSDARDWTYSITQMKSYREIKRYVGDTLP